MNARVSKLHATGNDFLVVLAPEWPAGSDAERGWLARALCDRRRGIGADGLIVLAPGAGDVDATMTLHNADGAVAEMSGNGIRCLAWVAVREGLGADGRLAVDTAAGRREIDVVVGASGTVEFATVDMGAVTFEPADIPLTASTAFDLEATYHGTEYRGDAAGVGNPHLVLLVDDVDAARVTQHGPHLEHDERFPKGTNVEFVNADGRDAITMRVWERGVGETLSCGTGACAAAAVAHRRGLVGDHVTVHVPGGDLVVELGDTVRLGGPVTHVFDVDLDLSSWSDR